MMIALRSFSVFSISFLLLSHCTSLSIHKIDFDKRIKQISEKHILDSSLEVNEIIINQSDQGLIISGMTTNDEYFNDIKSFSDSLSFVNDVLLLPDSALKDSIFGIINVSVAPIRDYSSHTAQMVDQAIMGNLVKILFKEGDWFLCQTHYDYVGWITKSSVYHCTTDYASSWKKKAKHRVKKLNSVIHLEPDITSIPVSDAVLNNLLIHSRDLDSWAKVILPDGRVGFINKQEIELVREYQDYINQESMLISNAISMIGIPYLWGGNSSKGNDCSGFTQTVFMASGIQLPRDARQQALVGKTINYGQFKKGDLLFFGNEDRITHVGISIGEEEFIHQGSKLEGKVDMHSLNPDSPIFNSYRKETFLFAKRVINR